MTSAPTGPKVMIGLLITAEGIQSAHHVFPGNTNDASTLPEVLADLQERFGVASPGLRLPQRPSG